MTDSLIKDNNSPLEDYKNEILVITMDDNLIHPYFSSIDLNKDNITPIGSCILVAPYDREIEKYWINYHGPVVVSFKMQNIKQTNTNSEDYFNNTLVPSYTKYQEKQREKALKNTEQTEEGEEKKIQQNIVNDYYNFSFIGRVGKFKQRGKKYIIYLEDLGWKFMQKVPKEFRNSFVAGQTLDDAFQAMCEFMEIEFAYSIEDLNECNFAADGYSVEKDGEILEDVPQILRDWVPEKEEEEVNIEDLENNPGLEDYLKNKAEDGAKVIDKILEDISPIYKDGKDLGENIADSIDSLTDNGEDKDKEQSLQEKKEQYQEEFDEKIRNLFIGNNYYPSNLCDPVLNYDAITIEPKSVSSSDMSTSGTTGGSDESQMSEDESREYNATAAGTGRSKIKNGWINGQYYINGKIYLSKQYINTLSRQQAHAKYVKGENVYTPDTLQKLQWRSWGIPLL